MLVLKVCWLLTVICYY